jgi:hypothetical protein
MELRLSRPNRRAETPYQPAHEELAHNDGELTASLVSAGGQISADCHERRVSKEKP